MTAYLRSLFECRMFYLSLARHDIRKRYRRSIFGAGWALLHPVLMALVLCLVFSRAFGVNFAEHFGFVLTGLCFWNYLGYVTTWGCQSIRYGEHYIRQHRAPLAIYPLRFALVAGFHFIVAVVPIVLVAWSVKGPPSAAAVACIPFSLALLLVFGWSLATIFGVTNVYVPDSQHVCEVGMHILFYATPIIWRPDVLRLKDLDWIVHVNPLASFLEVIRNPILQGTAPSLAALQIMSLTVMVSFLCACLTLARVERRIILYL